MGKEENQHTEKIVVLKNTISKVLSSVRKDRAMVQNLFELLENDDNFYNKEPQFIKIALGGRNLNGNDVPNTLYQSFCEAYTIRLLEEYVRHQKYLYLLFATFGFLPGYKDLFLKERYAKYAEENPNVKFKEGTKAIAELKDPSSSLQKTENEKIDAVAARLENDISKKGGRLGFVSAVLDELAEKFPAGLPEELPADFLKPIRTDSPSDKVLSQNVVLENDKINRTDSAYAESLSVDTAQAADDDSVNSSEENAERRLKVFTDGKLVSMRPLDNPTEEPSLAEQDKPSELPSGNTYQEKESGITGSQSDKVADVEPDNAPQKGWDKRKFLKWLSEHIVAILILLVMISHIPSFQEEGEPTGEDSPEIISFSVMNPDICLVPGARELIDVNAYPDEGDKSRLSIESQNPEIAWTDHLWVIANGNIQDENEYSTTVTVKGDKAPSVDVHVTVKKPEPVEHYSLDHIGAGTNIDNGGEE